MNKIGMIEQNLKTIGVKLEYIQLKHKSHCVMLIHIVINIFHLVTLAYADYTSIGNVFESICRTLITFYDDYAQICHVLHFCSVAFITGNILKNLKIYLNSIVANSTKDAFDEEFMHNIAVIYEDIFDYFREYISIVSLQLLLEFGTVFTIITFHTFNLLVVLIRGECSIKYIITICFSMFLLLHGFCSVTMYLFASELYRKEVSI